MYFSTIHAVWTVRRQAHAWRSTIFSTWLFVFATLNLIGNALSEQWAYINYRGIPGGPPEFILSQGDISPNTFGNVAGVMVTWTADALLVYHSLHRLV